jgi:V8-like Glu-specific endopeptidase
MKFTSLVPILFSLGAAAVSGCVAELEDPAELSPEESDEAAQPLTSSPSTTAERWIVNVAFPNGRCTASVLTAHWLLTAGHCVEDYALGGLIAVTVKTVDVSGSVVTVYSGNARSYTHPNYHPGNTTPDVNEDIAIVKLEGLAGINVGYTGKAKLWGYNAPWASNTASDRAFSIIGYGLSDAQCEGSDSTKRLATGFTMDREAIDVLSLKAHYGATHTCGGDSGAPWLITEGGVRKAVAVHSGRYFDIGSLDMKQQASLIPPRRTWMFDTSRSHTNLKLDCGTECTESPHNPLPPPGPSCPSGQHCCEPGAGNECLQCLPNAVSCP